VDIYQILSTFKSQSCAQITIFLFRVENLPFIPYLSKSYAHLKIEYFFINPFKFNTL